MCDTKASMLMLDTFTVYTTIAPFTLPVECVWNTHLDIVCKYASSSGLYIIATMQLYNLKSSSYQCSKLKMLRKCYQAFQCSSSAKVIML